MHQGIGLHEPFEALNGTQKMPFSNFDFGTAVKQATKSVDVSKSVSAAVGSVSKSIDISKALPSVSVSKGSPVSVDVSKVLPSVSVSKSAAVAAPASTASFSKSFEVSHCCAAVLARAAMSCFLAIWHLVGYAAPVSCAAAFCEPYPASVQARAMPVLKLLLQALTASGCSAPHHRRLCLCMPCCLCRYGLAPLGVRA